MAITVATLANGAADADGGATATTASVSPTSGSRVFLAYSWGGPTTGANMLSTLPTFGGTLSRTTSNIIMWNECGENFITQTDMGVGMVEMVGWSGTGTISITLPTNCLDILTFVWEVIPGGGEDISTLCWTYNQGNSTQARTRVPNGNCNILGYVSLFGNGAGGAARTHAPLAGFTEMTNSEIAEADGFISMACGYQVTTATLAGDDANSSCAWGQIGWSLGPEPTRPYPLGPVGPHVKNTTTATTSSQVIAHAIPTTDRMIIGRIAADNSGTNGAISGLTPTDTRSNSWAVRSVNNDPGAANAGCTLYHAYALALGTAMQAGDTITCTWGTTTPAKAIYFDEWVIPTGSVASVDGVSASATGSSTTPSTGAITPSAAGELFIGTLAEEAPNSDAYTNDADSTDGTFRKLSQGGSFNATATSNQKVSSEWKVVTGVSAQTYNPTITSRDWATEGLVIKFANNVSAASPFNVPISMNAPTITTGSSGASVTPTTLATILAMDTAGAKVTQPGVVWDNPISMSQPTITVSTSTTPTTIAAVIAADTANVSVGALASVITALIDVLTPASAKSTMSVTPTTAALLVAFPEAAASVGAMPATMSLITDVLLATARFGSSMTPDTIATVVTILTAAAAVNASVTATITELIVSFPEASISVGGAGCEVHPGCIEMGGGVSLVVVMDD